MADIVKRREVAAPVHEIVRLLREPEEWLDEVAEAASTSGEAVTATLRARFDRGPLHVHASKRAHLEVGRVQRLRDRFVVPLTWEATGFAGLFPVMDAVIEVYAYGTDATLVVFWGRYDPPLGRMGDLIDRVVAHEAAESTVDRLLDGLGERAAARVSLEP